MDVMMEIEMVIVLALTLMLVMPTQLQRLLKLQSSYLEYLE